MTLEGIPDKILQPLYQATVVEGKQSAHSQHRIPSALYHAQGLDIPQHHLRHTMPKVWIFPSLDLVC